MRSKNYEDDGREYIGSVVAEHDADYRTHAEWLEQNSTKLIFSREDL